MSDTRQRLLDRFYHANGPCCAGCDWWQHHNGLVGDCTRSAPVSGRERSDMLAVVFTSAPPPAGHVVTYREHVCGEFQDNFDWASLPLAYRKEVGAA